MPRIKRQLNCCGLVFMKIIEPVSVPCDGIYINCVFYSRVPKAFLVVESSKLGVNLNAIFLLFSTPRFDFNEYLMTDNNIFLYPNNVQPTLCVYAVPFRAVAVSLCVA